MEFGHLGLFVNIMRDTLDQTRVKGNILLSTDPAIICRFLGLDYQRWLSGFNEPTDVFQWVIECQYFDRNVFSHQNHIHRK